MPSQSDRRAAEKAAAELLRDLIGSDYSDTTLRVATDHLLSFHRASSVSNSDEIESALSRLIDVASSDTGQSLRVARFLMAWWNGDELGHFPIADLFGVDASIARDMATVFAWLGQHPGAIYIDELGHRDAIQSIISRHGILKAA